MVRFATIVKGFEQLTTVGKLSILDIGGVLGTPRIFLSKDCILTKIFVILKKSNKIGQDQKSLISAFA